MSTDKLIAALHRIAAWDDCDASFRADVGANGERDHYRRVAHEALAEHEAEQQAERTPLTDAQIDALDLASRGVMSVRDMVRVVERAHGITSKEQP